MHWLSLVFLSSGSFTLAHGQEAYARRACKFRPLPIDLNEGYKNLDGSVRIGEVFGLPVAAITGQGHNITLTIPEGGSKWLGLATQLAFSSTVRLQVDVYRSAGRNANLASLLSQEAIKCRHTWGAGGRGKQCVLEHVELPPGKVLLSFRASNAGDEARSDDGVASPSSCLSVRLDMEIVDQDTMEYAKRCLDPRSPPPDTESHEAEVSIPVATYSERGFGVGVSLFRALMPVGPGSHNEAQLALLEASVNFVSWVLPVQLLVEELPPEGQEAQEKNWPACQRRCWGGTATPSGQSVQRLVPVNVRYRLWLLAPYAQVGGCNNYDFQVSRRLVPQSKIQEHFLGPPATMCQGAVWPSTIAQTASPEKRGEASAQSAYTGRSIDIDDIFDVTMPSSAGKYSVAAGVHALELTISEPSILQLTAYEPSVPVRPVLLQGPPEQAWVLIGTPLELPSFRIPTAGRDDGLHSMHTVLSPGRYSLAFHMELPTGGLRSCAHVRVRLRLQPQSSLSSSPMSMGQQRCSDYIDSDLGEQLRTPWNNPTSFELAQQFSLRLPRPPTPMLPAPALAGLEILAVSSGNLDGLQPKESALLRAAVETAHPGLQLFIQIFINGEPQAEPQRLQSSMIPGGDGHFVLAGPFSRLVTYEIVIFRVPAASFQAEAIPSSDECVTLAVDVVAKKIAVESMVELLPGAAVCQLAATRLPLELQVKPQEQLTFEGEFALPHTPTYSFKVRRKQPGSTIALRAHVASRDAAVRIRLADEPPGAGQDDHEDMQVILWDDQRWHDKHEELTVTLLIDHKPSLYGCPTLKLHLVAVHFEDVARCSESLAPVINLGSALASAMTLQHLKPGLEAGVQVFHGDWAGQDLPEVPFEVSVPFAELRFELGMYPAFFPVEVAVVNANAPDSEWARASPSGHRFVLNLPSLPMGKYLLRIRLWPAMVAGAAAIFRDRCLFVKVAALLADPADHDTSNIRQEMLNQPELLLVPRLPASLSFRMRPQGALHLYSQMFAIDAEGSTAGLHLAAESIFRFLAEPADILLRSLTLVIMNDKGQLVEQASDTMGGTALRLPAGSYQVKLTPGTTPSGRQTVAFMITVGFAPLALFKKASSPLRCSESFHPVLKIGSPPQTHFTIRSWRRVEKLISKGSTAQQTVPFRVEWPAVVTIMAWSNFVFRYIRVGLKTVEGLWVGEQRLQVSALEIELPPGDYLLQVEESNPVFDTEMAQECFEFGVGIVQSAFAAPPLRMNALLGEGLSVADVTSRSLGVGARCDGLGASPLPLDFFSSSGGSAPFGGPVDAQGRLLIRQRFLLTDIHDGRKKVFFKPPLSGFLRLVVSNGDASALEVTLEDGSHATNKPVISWSDGSQGWSATYQLEASSNTWINFHREHRDASASSCASFDLLAQFMPSADVLAMTRCPEQPTTLERVLQDAYSSGQSEGFFTVVDLLVPAHEHIDITSSQDTLLEVEVSFNFFIAHIDAWISSAGGGEELPRASAVGSTGTADSALNAHVLLQQRLQPGKHRLHVEYAFALGSSAMASRPLCLPLRVSIRRALPAHAVRVAPLAGLAAPLPLNEDLVVIAAFAEQPPRGSVTVAGVPPRTLSRSSGSTLWVAVWEGSVLTEAVQKGSGTSRIPASTGGGGLVISLPLQLGSVVGEVWAFVQEAPLRPWSGEGRSSLVAAPLRPFVVQKPPQGGVEDALVRAELQQIHPPPRPGPWPHGEQERYERHPPMYAGPFSRHPVSMERHMFRTLKGTQQLQSMGEAAVLPTTPSPSYVLEGLIQTLGWIVVLVIFGCLAARTGIAKPLTSWCSVPGFAEYIGALLPSAGSFANGQRPREMASVVEITRSGYGATGG